MSTKKEKQTEVWAAWTSTFTKSTRKAIQNKEESVLPVERTLKHQDDETESYHHFRESLTSSGKETLDSTVKPSSSQEEVDTSVARYGIVECPDGEWGMMRLYKSVEGLARRVGQLEGTDTVAWCFFGLPIQITKGPQRYLILPGGEVGVMIPMLEGGPCKKVPGDLLLNLEIQDDGFIGPVELANTRMIEAKFQTNTPTEKEDSEDDEDDSADVE